MLLRVVCANNNGEIFVSNSFYLGCHLSPLFGISAERGKHIPKLRAPCYTIQPVGNSSSYGNSFGVCNIVFSESGFNSVSFNSFFCKINFASTGCLTVLPCLLVLHKHKIAINRDNNYLTS